VVADRRVKRPRPQTGAGRVDHRCRRGAVKGVVKEARRWASNRSRSPKRSTRCPSCGGGCSPSTSPTRRAAVAGPASWQGPVHRVRHGPAASATSPKAHALAGHAPQPVRHAVPILMARSEIARDRIQRAGRALGARTLPPPPGRAPRWDAYTPSARHLNKRNGRSSRREAAFSDLRFPAQREAAVQESGRWR
jgi:hypothetical protein